MLVALQKKFVFLGGRTTNHVTTYRS